MYAADTATFPSRPIRDIKNNPATFSGLTNLENVLYMFFHSRRCRVALFDMVNRK